MAVSVIVSNFNGAQWLPRLLETLKAQNGVTMEIIVVDRDSTDESAMILARHPDVKVVQEPPESGLVAGYAVGVPHARYEKLFFCNEDMWFSPDCLRLVELQFDTDARVGAVMPIQLSYDGTRSVNAGTWFAQAAWHRANPYPFRASTWRKINSAELVSGINAGACMILRSAYEDVSGWDKTFFLDYEDTDLSLRLWQRDWVCRIEPRALVYHAVGASNAKTIDKGRSSVSRKRYIWAFSNKLAIVVKYFNGAWPLLLPPIMLADQMLRDLIKLRFKNLKLDFAIGWVTLRRLPLLLHYRRVNREWNRRNPGQQYFKDPRFEAATS